MRFWFVSFIVISCFALYFGRVDIASAQLTGQIVADPNHPNRMIYFNQTVNGKPKPVVLCGPGDPEDFFYNDTFANLNLLKSRGAKTTYIVAYLRDFGGGNPGTDAQLDQTLNTWESYITQLEAAGITTVFFFYDDSQALTSDWQTAVPKIVNKLKHHKLLIWSVAEEYKEGMTQSQASQVAALIKQYDNNKHVIGIHQNSGTAFDFNADTNMQMFLIQNNVSNTTGVHNGILNAFSNTNGKKILTLAEVAGHAQQDRVTVRQWNWSAVMGGASMVQVYEMGRASDTASWNDPAKYNDCAVLTDFFESTLINEMQPNDGLKHADTTYVLANPGQSYIAYIQNTTGQIGLRSLTAGTYSFTWLDIPTGNKVTQSNLLVDSGDQAWNRPNGIGSEAALYLVRQGAASVTPTTAPLGSTFPGASWQTKTPAELQLDPAKLDQLATSIGGTGVVVRNGYLVKTWGSATALGEWASASKPLFSTLLFFALQEGKLSSVDAKVNSYGWNLNSKDQSMTLRHLVNMVSGYARGESPGTAWAYNDYGVQLFNKTLHEKIYGIDSTNATAVSNLYMASNRLGPLQFQDGSLFRIKSDAPRVNMTPRDYARVGWLWLNKGNWNGKQILPKSYFDSYMKVGVVGNTPRTSSSGTDYLGVGSYGGNSDQNDDGQGTYGFFWWFNGNLHTSNQRIWPDAPADTFMANGHDGKEVMVIMPDLGIVVAARGTWGGMTAANGINKNLKLLNESVLGAVPVGTPTLTPSGAATPTFAPGSTIFNLNLLLYGLGSGGDNVNPSGNGNANPLRKDRQVTLELYDASNQHVASKQGIVSFNSSHGDFKGSVNAGNLTAGVYTVKVVTSQFLKKTIPGIVNVTSGEILLPQVALVSGDTNSDNLLSILDYNIIFDCFADFGTPRNCTDTAKKQNADLTDDGNVNQFDYNLFIRELSVQQGQ